MEAESAPLPPDARKRIEEAAMVIEGILLFARPEILKVYGLTSCIESGRVVFEVLRRYDLKPRAIAAQVRIFNPALVARVNREGRQAQTQEEVMRWSREDGSWNVGIGGTGLQDPGRWDGHLVCLAYGVLLIDVSIDQANRPERNIHLKPVAATVPDGWATGKEQLMFEENGCMVTYKADPDNRDWLQHGGWTAPSPLHKQARARVVDAVCLKIEAWLADA